MAKDKKEVRVKVLRFNPCKDKESRYKTYEVPFKERMTVLWLLNYIYDNLDASLSYYYSCGFGRCGGCTVLVNGKACLACLTRPQPQDEIIIEPIPGYKVIKDLVVDLKEPSIIGRNKV